MDGTKIASGGGVGVALGTGAVYLANRLGANLTPEDGAVAASAAIAIAAFVAHNGVRGAFAMLWRGPKTSTVIPPP